MCNHVKVSIPCKGNNLVYPLNMPVRVPDPWPQRQHFRHLVDIWMETKKKTKKDFAALCKIEPDSLKQYYSGKHVPGRSLALRFATVLGCPIAELLGDPGTTATNKIEDEEVRSFANTMYFLGKDMTPEQRKAVIEMVKAGRALGRERRETEKKGRKA